MPPNDFVFCFSFHGTARNRLFPETVSRWSVI
jgi:hypothetical protein